MFSQYKLVIVLRIVYSFDNIEEEVLPHSLIQQEKKRESPRRDSSIFFQV